MTTEFVDVEDDDFDEDDFDDCVYLKYMHEGINTIEELAASLHALARDFEEKAAAGWRLAEPVDNGWAHLDPPADVVKARKADRDVARGG